MRGDAEDGSGERGESMQNKAVNQSSAMEMIKKPGSVSDCAE